MTVPVPTLWLLIVAVTKVNISEPQIKCSNRLVIVQQHQPGITLSPLTREVNNNKINNAAEVQAVTTTAASPS